MVGLVLNIHASLFSSTDKTYALKSSVLLFSKYMYAEPKFMPFIWIIITIKQLFQFSQKMVKSAFTIKLYQICYL